MQAKIPKEYDWIKIYNSLVGGNSTYLKKFSLKDLQALPNSNKRVMYVTTTEICLNIVQINDANRVS